MVEVSKTIRHKRKMKRHRRITLLVILLIISIPITYIIKNKFDENSSVKYLDNMGVSEHKISSLRDKLGEYEKGVYIKELDYGFKEKLEENTTLKTIIFHHAGASTMSPEDINKDHKEKGYEGIGYHFYIRKDGAIYRGRPEEAKGAHAYGSNRGTLGICIEGNLENENITESQINSLIKLSADMIIKYNIENCIGHRDVFETLCPGKNFPMDEIKNRIKEELIRVDSN